MEIIELCKRYGLSSDTTRYCERVGSIHEGNHNKSRVRKILRNDE